MKVILTPRQTLVLSEISDINRKLDSVFFRTDINEPPQPSVRVEQAVKTILEIRRKQKKEANIICTSHSSKTDGTLTKNFAILESQVQKELDPISEEINAIFFVNSFEEMAKANEENTGSLIFLDNIRRTIPEELKPPPKSTETQLWKYFSGMTKIHGALSCCHRDNLSLRLFSENCFCNKYFIRELEDITNLYHNENGDITLWGIAGAKEDKLDSIYVTEGKDDLMVVLDGGPVFVLLLWALAKEAPSLSKAIPQDIGRDNKDMIQEFYQKKWEDVKNDAETIARKIESGTIKVILPIDVIVSEKGKERVADLKDIGKGRFVSIGPNTITMIGNMSRKRIFLQNGSVEPTSSLARKYGSTTFLFMREILAHSKYVYLNGGDTVADVRTLEDELSLSTYRKGGILRELAVGGFVVNWWNYLKGGEMPAGVRYASIGSLMSLYEVASEEKGYD